MRFFDARPACAGLLALGLLVACAMAHAAPVDATAAEAGSLPASIPVKREATNADEWRAGVVGPFGIAAVLALAGGGLYAVRRKTRAAATAGPGLSHSSALRLTPRHSLHVVEWEGRQLLVGCSEQAICLVAESPRGPSTEGGA